MKKFFAKVHLWLSVPLGIILSVVCFTGASLVFESEITRWISPELYRATPPVGAEPLAPSVLVERVRRQLPDSLHIASVQWPGDPEAACMVTFRETGRRSLSVDPYTGEVNGWTRSHAFFRTMRQMHRWLLDSPERKGEMSVGKALVGWATLGMVVILVSGLVIWCPRSRQMLKNRLRLEVRKGWRRFLYDSHVALGFYVTLILLVMALTGLTWSFGWYRTAAYGLFGGGAASNHAAAAPSESRGPRTDEPDFGAWDRVMGQLQARYPHYRAMTLSHGEVQVAPRPNSYMRRVDRVAFDPSSGAIVSVARAEEQPRQQQLRGWFYAFHTGTWGGLTVKILWFVAALVGGTLPLTGYWMWLRRRRGIRTGRAGRSAMK